MSIINPSSPFITAAVLRLKNGETGKAFLTIHTVLGDDFTLAVPGTHVRLMIVLEEARRKDRDDPASQGWRTYDTLIKQLAARFNDAELLRETIISYAYRLQQSVLNAGLKAGLDADELVFVERQLELGARLIVPLTIIDPDNDRDDDEDGAGAAVVGPPRLPR